MVDFALNQMTVPRLEYGAFLDLAARLGCVGVEARNDLERPLFDGLGPGEAGEMARDRGLRLVGLSQVYPFNDWSEATGARVRDLVALAGQAGAETISLIPRNDGTATGNGIRHANLRIALKNIRPIVEEAGLVALVEPLGFARSSLRSKAETVETIRALDAGDVFRIVHDTFHHALAGGDEFFPAETGLVHVSGVVDPALALDRMEDAHRVLVDGADRLGNLDQLRALIRAGYGGVVSLESFSPEVQGLDDPEPALRRSLDHIASELAAEAA